MEFVSINFNTISFEMNNSFNELFIDNDHSLLYTVAVFLLKLQEKQLPKGNPTKKEPS